MSGKVRLGAVGAGWWATSNHFPIFAAREDVELVGVCGIGPELERVREQFGFGMATENYDELLAQDLDAVVITTPHDLHYAQAVQAIERGLHVLVEKPVTLSAEQGWDLERRVRERGVVFLAPYGWNYKPFTVEAKRLVDAGHIGQVQYALCHMASPTLGLFAGDTNHIRRLWDSQTSGPDPRTWQTPSKGGGYAHGQITHSSALLFWLFDDLRAETVTAKVSTAGSAVDLYDAAVVGFSGGALGTVSGAASLPDGSSYQVDIRVFGSEGVLLLDTERERVSVRRHDGQEWNIDIPEGAGEYECIEPPNRFIDLILGRSTENNSTADVAARSIELIDAMLRSSAAGGTEIAVQNKEPVS
ncbi:Gfo/Idh/MocA family oxidoreductase [Microbacterium sp. Sa4CUA7]|uniref:Gfo/Idh/MocA family oxidoreductase n=1 Tax=Microbacterium pullorum TaxID=2762236 RepID=A0ABR8S2N1_9MICO|nr:Gfo/Idh/MocA family oxidoreductase [Microbacterium pullorum]MBD7957732.1 Gfo/Idh/MocA family oxidoreductase [Microbacterium pullorum]